MRAEVEQVLERIRPQLAMDGCTVDVESVEEGVVRLRFAGGCMGCHGPGLSGGPVPGTPPDFKPALNITPGGRPGQWSEVDFISAMRTGTTKDGYKLDEFMPWKAVGQLTDDELKAMWAYLESVPAKEYGNR